MPDTSPPPPPPPPRRGRPPRPTPAAPTGYRATAATRRQLHIAIGFTDEPSLQAIIDRAVQDFLVRLREAVPGFAEAVDAAETHVTGAIRNVTRLPR
jgi:hypothetical protein